jgi:nucleoside-specific outer membrane channel protein Tsx
MQFNLTQRSAARSAVRSTVSNTVRNTICGTAVLLFAACGTAQGADWSDTSLSYRYGTKFAEPFNPEDISKHIINLSHISGYAYGTNFVSVDFLFSSKDDPSSAGSTDGAQEAYVVYRHTLDIGKVTGANLAFGPVRGVGATVGFDVNTKNDAGYNSKKRMLVAGPTLMMDVPGFLNISLLALHESNAPYNTFTSTATPRYTYNTHAMVSLAWGIPFNAGIPLSFEGYANFIDSKGTDEFGGKTAPETDVNLQVMYDLSETVGAKKNTFKLGLQYQYWKNKFGTNNIAGSTARTPMVRAEYHF